MADAAIHVAATTIQAALRRAYARLSRLGSPQLDAQTLLAHCLGLERSFLFAHGENQLTTGQLGDYEALLKRRETGEPVAYILGMAGFYDLELRVTPATLIPRPETELLLEEALRLAAAMPSPVIADIGTGSGALAIAFKCQRPGSLVHASDISAAALEIASRNAARYAADIRFWQGSLAQPISERGIRVDLLMANLPYVKSDDLHGLDVSRWEPWLALDGGADGLRLIDQLLAELESVCKPGAWILLEIGADQGQAARRLVRYRLGLPAEILTDYAGLDRILRFQLA